MIKLINNDRCLIDFSEVVEGGSHFEEKVKRSKRQEKKMKMNVEQAS